VATKLKIVDGPQAIAAEFIAEVDEVEEVDSPVGLASALSRRPFRKSTYFRYHRALRQSSCHAG